MKEFGFEVPFNALVVKDKILHFIIKRFDVIDSKRKREQYSLNALMKHTSMEKYNGDIESICEYIAKVDVGYSKAKREKLLIGIEFILDKNGILNSYRPTYRPNFMLGRIKSLKIFIVVATMEINNKIDFMSLYNTQIKY